jgi:C_GCAxxG_C_C family probable redox protein
MSKKEEAVECFKNTFNCSQAVFSSFAEELGLEKEKALKIGCGFGAGMARMGETCGAVTGAFMAIGLKYGKSIPSDNNEAREKTYAKIHQFVDEFKAKNKSIMCRELLACDLATPEGRQYAADNNLFAEVCKNLVSDAAEIVDKVMK